MSIFCDCKQKEPLCWWCKVANLLRPVFGDIGVYAFERYLTSRMKAPTPQDAA